MKTRLFTCNHQGCNKSFRDEESNIRHALKHSLEESNSKAKFVCGKCLRNFSTKQSLREHRYTHSGKKTFKCQEPGCGKAFRQSSQLCNHRKIHKRGRPINSSQSLDLTREISNEYQNSNQFSGIEDFIELPLITQEKLTVKLPNFNDVFKL